jgi:nucleoside 2-deoxyribosyltransferase
MIVIGGIYQEVCISNSWDYIFGSAGRAAAILAGPLNEKVTLHGWYSERQLNSLNASFAPYEIDLRIRTARNHHTFEYFHPLSDPRVLKKVGGRWNSKELIKGENVLLFGALEGFPAIVAKKLVIDPQGEDVFKFLSSDRIQAKQIVVVANENEVMRNTAATLKRAVAQIFGARSSIVAVVIKCGVRGALLFRRPLLKTKRVCPYYSEKIFKIGSGDVFSAAFSHAWMAQANRLAAATDFASRCVASYVNDPSMNFTRAHILERKRINLKRSNARIYLAAPFFTAAELMFLAEARRALLKLGVVVFSPLHEVGISNDQKEIARKDLAGLTRSHAVFAMLDHQDPGTIFEVGYARALDIPAVIFAEHFHKKDTTMFVGTNCKVESDFCTAIHHAVWAGLT